MTCPDCGSEVFDDVVTSRGDLGIETFSAEPVIGGPWRRSDDGMTRHGCGPGKGYVLHVRDCPHAERVVPVDHAWRYPVRSREHV